MSEHTPGPFYMQDRLSRTGPCGIDIRAETTGHIVAQIPDGATIHGGHAFPTQLGNAHLFVAAPDSLEACKLFIDSVEMGCLGPAGKRFRPNGCAATLRERNAARRRAIDAARAAIAKAQP